MSLIICNISLICVIILYDVELLWFCVNEYISEYVSEYTSKHVSEYTSEYISECTCEYTNEYNRECTSECTSDYVRKYISEYGSEYISEYISEHIRTKKETPPPFLHKLFQQADFEDPGKIHGLSIWDHISEIHGFSMANQISKTQGFSIEGQAPSLRLVDVCNGTGAEVINISAPLRLVMVACRADPIKLHGNYLRHA